MIAPQSPAHPERNRRQIRLQNRPELRKIPRAVASTLCLALFAVVLTLVDDELCR